MTTRHAHRRLRVFVPSLLVAGLALAACGDDDDTTPTAPATGATDAPAPTTTSPPATTPPPSTTAPPTSPPSATNAPEGEADVVDVVLSDYAFGGIPESVPAGTKLRVQNTSEKELHELIAFRLPDNEKRPVDKLVALPPAALEGLFAGPPATVLVAPPGGPQIDAVGDGTLTEPGRYVVFCAIPKGADPQEYMDAAQQGGDGPPEVDGGPPHFMEGMYAEVTVT